MKSILLSIFIYFSVQHVAAQISSIKKAQQNFDKAQLYIKSDNYEEAILALNNALTADPKFQYALLQLGDIQRRIKSFVAAKETYKKALAIDQKIDPRVYYGLAESEIFTGNYDEALDNIKRFIENYKGNDKDFITKANKYLKDCEFSISALKAPQDYSPKNMGKEINSANRDYFPAITADGNSIIFSRNVNGNEDFYISERNSDKWSVPRGLSEKINTINYNEGAQSISPDGKYLFFTGCNRPDGLGRCDIYISHKQGKDWGDPFNLGNPINTQYWESQPAISPDGSVLYFVSNRPGGLGGYDIWKSKLQNNGYWSKPENLGPDINTPYNEHTPFMHPDGKTLYFSSDGWPGLGNQDIFLSRMNESGRWSIPENMGYPINTFNEETGLIVTPDGTEGLFSSILKEGFGDMDIYHFKMPADKKPTPITYVKGVVIDKNTAASLEAQVQIVNLKNGKIEYSDYTSADTGDFLAVMSIGGNYAFNVSADGYFFHSENYELSDAYINKPFLLEIRMDKLKTGNNIVLKNIFFDTNKYNLLQASFVELGILVELLKTNPTVQIEIQGHTDNVGNDESNLKLSMLRAKSVYDYLLRHQIAPERLSYQGFGETKPILSNDSDMNRKLNRRSSFIITKL